MARVSRFPASFAYPARFAAICGLPMARRGILAGLRGKPVQSRAGLARNLAQRETIMATLAVAFAAATPRRGKRKTRLVSLGRIGLGSQAGNGAADLNAATGQQLVAVARSEGIGARGIPTESARTVQVRRAIYPAIAPNLAATQNAAQAHGAVVAQALSSVQQLSDLVGQLASLGISGNAVQRSTEPFGTPLYSQSRRAQFGRKSRSVMRPVLTETAPGRVVQSLPAPVAIRRISEAVAALLAQYGAPDQTEG